MKNKADYIIAKANYIPENEQKKITIKILKLNSQKRMLYYVNKALDFIENKTIINNEAFNPKERFPYTSLTKSAIQKIAQKLWKNNVLQTVDSKQKIFSGHVTLDHLYSDLEILSDELTEA